VKNPTRNEIEIMLLVTKTLEISDALMIAMQKKGLLTAPEICDALSSAREKTERLLEVLAKESKAPIDESGSQGSGPLVQ
jgi:predicted thioredoxin/glutaredoxin